MPNWRSADFVCFIVDINSDLPVILCSLDENSSLEKSYYHVGAQVIAQKEAGADGELFYYVHDRLGSVRAVIDTDMLTVNEYSYDSFGKMYTEECYEATDSQTGEFIAENPFKYTGQYYDAEIGQYYVRARMYDPQMRRFTGRDPERGNFDQTMSLHRYLYCWNNPTNMVDLNGKNPVIVWMVLGAASAIAGDVADSWETGVWNVEELLLKAMMGATFGALGGIGAELFVSTGAKIAIGLGDIILTQMMSNSIDRLFAFVYEGETVTMQTTAMGLYVYGGSAEAADAAGKAWCDSIVYG